MQVLVHIALSLNETEDAFQPCVHRWDVHGCCERQNKALHSFLEETRSDHALESAKAVQLVELCRRIQERLASVPPPQQLIEEPTLQLQPETLQSTEGWQLQCIA
jgi:hypothetical protein